MWKECWLPSLALSAGLALGMHSTKAEAVASPLGLRELSRRTLESGSALSPPSP